MTEKATATKTALAPAPGKSIESQSLLEQFDRVYDSIARRAFEIFERDGRMFGRDLYNWLKAEAELLHPVKVTVTETDNTLNIQAEVPGFTEKELQIQLEPRRLTISGKKETSEEQKKGKTVYQEQRSNEIWRVLDLPVEVKTENVNATLKNGVLEVQMLKIPKPKGTHVEVKTA